MARTIESLLAEIKTKGWKVNNLFELETGMWQVGVRRAVDTHKGTYKLFTEMCAGNTPAEALEGVLIDMGQPRNDFKPPPAGAALEYKQTGGRSAKSQALDLDRLIEESGL